MEKNGGAAWPGLLLILVLGLGSYACSYDLLPVKHESVFLFGILGLWYGLAMTCGALKRSGAYPAGRRLYLGILNLVSGLLWTVLGFLELPVMGIVLAVSGALCLGSGTVIFILQRKEK